MGFDFPSIAIPLAGGSHDSDPKEARRAEQKLDEAIRRDMEASPNPTTFRVTADRVREYRQMLAREGITPGRINTYLSDYFRSGNGSLMVRPEDASAVNQALNEPVPQGDPLPTGGDPSTDPRLPTAGGDGLAPNPLAVRSDARPVRREGVRSSPEVLRNFESAAQMVRGYIRTSPPTTRDDYANVRLLVRNFYTPQQLNDTEIDQLMLKLFPDADPGLLGLSHPPSALPNQPAVAPVVVADGAEPPAPVRFFSMGADFGPGKNVSPEDQAALLERGRGLTAMATRGGNMAGSPVPVPLPTGVTSGETLLGRLARARTGSVSAGGRRGSSSDRDDGSSLDGDVARGVYKQLGFRRA